MAQRKLAPDSAKSSCTVQSRNRTVRPGGRTVGDAVAPPVAGKDEEEVGNGYGGGSHGAGEAGRYRQQIWCTPIGATIPDGAGGSHEATVAVPT